MRKAQNSYKSQKDEFITFDDEVVKSIEFRELSKVRRFFFVICTILTAGILPLVCNWFNRIYVIMNYRKCPASRCTKVIVTDEFKNCHTCDRKTYVGGGKTINMFEYKHIPFTFDDTCSKFVPVRFDPAKPFFYYENVMAKGVSESGYKRLRALNGENSIEVKMKPLYKLVLDEGLHPFIVFQIFSIVIWCLFVYYYYAALIAVITLFSVIITIVQTRANMRNLRDMTRFECSVKVHRRGQKPKLISSKDLVPGDVFEVKNGMTMPCDALLINGTSIMNETMLTGESVPVIKNSIPHVDPRGEAAQAMAEIDRMRENQNSLADVEAMEEERISEVKSSVSPLNVLDLERDKSCILFGGTQVISARSAGKVPYRPAASADSSSQSSSSMSMSAGAVPVQSTTATPVCIAIRTAFSTAKGQLVRSILFPKPTKFKFYEDSFKFIGVMACIAFTGFVANAIIQTSYNTPFKDIILRAGDLVTIAVPPTLPAVMSAGSAYALARLKKKKIFCISPQRVNVAGKVKVMCFDKTGTLTEENLSVLGVQPAGHHSLRRATLANPSTAANVTPSANRTSASPNPSPVQSSPLQHSTSSAIPSVEQLSVVKPNQEPHFILSPNNPSASSINNNNNSGDAGPPGDGHSCYFSSLESDLTALRHHDDLVTGLACCHSVATVDGVNVGDPLDVKMFEYTEWAMKEKADTYLPSKTDEDEEEEQNGNNTIDKVCASSASESSSLKKPSETLSGSDSSASASSSSSSSINGKPYNPATFGVVSVDDAIREWVTPTPLSSHYDCIFHPPAHRRKPKRPQQENSQHQQGQPQSQSHGREHTTRSASSSFSSDSSVNSDSSATSTTALLAEPHEEPADSPGDVPKVLIGVLRRLDFSAALQRMSVIVHRNEAAPALLASANQSGFPTVPSSSLEVFTKGSPEVILTLCVPESIPHDYQAQLKEHTQKGLRVLALGHRVLPMKDYEWVQTVQREEVEKDLTFLGFFIMENKLKPSTPAAIHRLKEASIRTLMITGDNPLTAIQVARECSIIPTPEDTQGSDADSDPRKKSRKLSPSPSPSSSPSPVQSEKPVHVYNHNENFDESNSERFISRELSFDNLSSRSISPLYSPSVASEDSIARDQPALVHPVFLAELDKEGNVTWKSNEFPEWTLDPLTLEPVRCETYQHGPIVPSVVEGDLPYDDTFNMASASSLAAGANEQSGINPHTAPGESPSPSFVSLSSDAQSSSSSNRSLPASPVFSACSTSDLSLQKVDPFEEWRGGPWAAMYCSNFELPSSFMPSMSVQSTGYSKVSKKKTGVALPRSAYFLAVTGSAFRKMYNDYQRLKGSDTNKPKMETNLTYRPTATSMFEKVCMLGSVFARMAPEDKAHLVETISDMGYITGMCGDGANDCAALKAAHVGVSLSEVEASIAAPFTSKVNTIECVEQLILEGRGALSSSFHSFKATCSFAMIQFVSTAILIAYNTILSDFDWLIIDILMTLPVLFTMGYSRAGKKLTRRSPPGALVSYPVISSLFLHIIVSAAVMGLSLPVMASCKEYVPLPPAKLEIGADNLARIQSYEVTTVFLASLLSYFGSAFIINLYDPFLEPFFKNVLYTIALIFVLIVTVFLVVQDIPWLIDFLQMKKLHDFKIYMYYVIAFFASILALGIFEYGVCQSNLPKRIYRKFHRNSKIRPKVVKKKVKVQNSYSPQYSLDNSAVAARNFSAINSSDGMEGNTVDEEVVHLVYRKPFYALVNEMYKKGNECMA
ncbi:putative P-type ATPase (P-ATPase) Superfamily Protein [Monocercomonoides exilis]|uniref:putative P-type ATPase (P-ATPase) Superfamily Protein n=1 Tax=Monocercomonoides exilis TaxID=2049356 RepID=UPI0035596DF3|nr:putative P-type ATPase (P-ATPase) Superfamily Protein [Monocercomonoides exilis]|eukprot:MONOS_1571.1-p1 / transcript=MONOS_1571.1 / gene=MONOS_1571 / organism=Monocercomonoides_exilis_PA203 / gene_product=P-type ATPase (P-ATPase) Superfamily Protein / transcript_product=P-type ATPase (P-ATPase) Superfamily Protein / location=Mono_scaffold00028:69144-74467(-) / protein_length=1747 / sequence_SO=supercontig / SO=protein_coding / is_pseudo=false